MRKYSYGLVVLFLSLGLLWSSSAYAISADGVMFYEGEGPFVEFPAMAGMIIMAVPIGLAAVFVVCFPSAIAPLLWHGEKSASDFMEGCFDASLSIPAIVGYAVVGAPFYVLKKIFFDFPRYLFGVIYGTFEGSHSSVTPSSSLLFNESSLINSTEPVQQMDILFDIG